jgi:NADH-quinone oxidoreductase subunit D
MELARISDHLICNSIVGVDTGAYTGFLYVMQYRELIYEIYEEVCGARLTTNIGRIGGFERNFTNTAFEKLEKFLKEYPAVLKEFENLFNRNRIFMERIECLRDFVWWCKRGADSGKAGHPCRGIERTIHAFAR